MSKHRWYELFGFLFKTKQIAEINRQLNDELV